jgi:hypothetical protein
MIREQVIHRACPRAHRHPASPRSVIPLHRAHRACPFEVAAHIRRCHPSRRALDPLAVAVILGYKQHFVPYVSNSLFK